ncbi:permease family domain-containing protein [Rhizoctonia solani AG-1 IA]|uniref:Permease family domain-containing protein n=1 Tax=Thanatephorus cucumeris (strain AG1-IA) TaxID=983506 RepID=L8WM90_THACA|nr:permease family domain-containing protein [Rhizoctonia solani AG-1 IA]
MIAVPNSVLGGVTTFLFASVMVSGIRVLATIKWQRRDRFILAAAFSFGLGDLLVPEWYTHLFDGVEANSGLQGLFDSITIVLSTPCKHKTPPYLSMTLTLPCSLDRRCSGRHPQSYHPARGRILIKRSGTRCCSRSATRSRIELD